MINVMTPVIAPNPVFMSNGNDTEPEDNDEERTPTVSLNVC